MMQIILLYALYGISHSARMIAPPGFENRPAEFLTKKQHSDQTLDLLKSIAQEQNIEDRKSQWDLCYYITSNLNPDLYTDFKVAVWIQMTIRACKSEIDLPGITNMFDLLFTTFTTWPIQLSIQGQSLYHLIAVHLFPGMEVPVSRQFFKFPRANVLWKKWYENPHFKPVLQFASLDKSLEGIYQELKDISAGKTPTSDDNQYQLFNVLMILFTCFSLKEMHENKEIWQAIKSLISHPKNYQLPGLYGHIQILENFHDLVEKRTPGDDPEALKTINQNIIGAFAPLKPDMEIRLPEPRESTPLEFCLQKLINATEVSDKRYLVNLISMMKLTFNASLTPKAFGLMRHLKEGTQQMILKLEQFHKTYNELHTNSDHAVNLTQIPMKEAIPAKFLRNNMDRRKCIILDATEISKAISSFDNTNPKTRGTCKSNDFSMMIIGQNAAQELHMLSKDLKKVKCKVNLTKRKYNTSLDRVNAKQAELEGSITQVINMLEDFDFV